MNQYTNRTDEFLSFLSYENNQMTSPTEIVSPSKNSISSTSEKKTRFFITSNALTRDLLQANERVKKLQELISKGDPFDEARQRMKTLSVRIGNDIKKLKLKVQGLQQEVEDNFRNSDERVKHNFPSDQERHQKQVIHLSLTMVEFLEKKYQWIMNEQRLKQRKKERRRKNYFNIRKRKTFNTTNNLLRPVQSHDDVLLMAESPKRDVESGSGKHGRSYSDGTAMDSGQTEEDEDGEVEPDYDFSKQKLAQVKYRMERSKEVQKVNKKLDQIQQMFMEFGKQVVAQRELAMRIDDQVTDAEVHTEMAQKELTKYHNTISSNRGLILKIFAILVLMVVFVGLFIIK